ncbi:MAG: glycosyltransferase family 39 protein [Bacteroidota bacterium]
MNKLTAFFNTGKYPLLLALLLNVCLHLPFFNRPPESMHVWRQCNTLAVARNFYQEDMNIFQPRVDNRFETNGVTGMNFPLYEYSVAALYKVFGEQFWVHRVFSLLVLSLGAIGLFYVVTALAGPLVMANLSAIALLFFPDLFYFGISALPDIMALSCMIWGLYFFIRWHTEARETNRSADQWLLLSAFFFMLCGLIKLYFLLIGGFIAGLVIPQFRFYFNARYIIRLIIFGFISVVIPMLWYKYSIDLIKRTGLADFGLEVRYETNISNAISILTQNIISDLPELILNYVNAVFVAIAAFYIYRTKAWKHQYFNAFLFFVAGAVLYHLAELKQMKYHSYYMMPYYPVLAIIAGYGAYKVYLFKPNVLLFFLLLSPVVCSTRIIFSRWANPNKLVPAELYHEDSRTRLQQAVNDKERCIISGDVSNCIFFYFLDKKGFCYAGKDQLLQQVHGGETQIANNISRGATTLYIKSDTDPAQSALAPYLKTLLLKEGSFYVYRLK